MVAFLCFQVVPFSGFAKKLIPITAYHTNQDTLDVMVFDDLGFLSDAQVWVESIDGKLLYHGTTEIGGGVQIDLSKAQIDAGFHLTVWKLGHNAVSFLHCRSGRVVVELNQQPSSQYSWLQGTLTEFPSSWLDAKVGFVAKTFTTADLVQLDSSSFVSPVNDVIDVFGERKIPSNIVLPDQTFTVYLVPISVNKPYYRVPMAANTRAKYFGITGVLDPESAVSSIRNSDPVGIIDALQFGQIGITPAFSTDSTPSTTRYNFKANRNLGSTIRVNVDTGSAPSNSGGTRRMIASIWEIEPGVYAPNDLKQVRDGRMELTAINRQNKVLDILFQLEPKRQRFRGGWVNGRVSRAKLQTDLTFDRNHLSWSVGGIRSDHKLMLTHMESEVFTSIGSKRVDDRWILVGPPDFNESVPVNAAMALSHQIANLTHISADLISIDRFDIQQFEGENVATAMRLFEKTRIGL